MTTHTYNSVDDLPDLGGGEEPKKKTKQPKTVDELPDLVKKKDVLSIGSELGGTLGASNGLLKSGVKISPQDQQRLDREKERETGITVDENDPVKSIVLPLRVRMDAIIGGQLKIESTGQNKPLKQSKSDEVNELIQTENYIRGNVFPNTYLAKQWLESHPDTEKNETSKIAKKIADDSNLVEQSLERNGSLINKAAVDYHISKDDNVGKHLKIMIRDGIEIPKELEGELVHDFLQNRRVREKSEGSQDFHNQVKVQEFDFYRNYPELRQRMILSKIAQGREDFGYNNFFLNLPGKKSSDDIVDRLIAEDKLSAEDKDFYEKNVRPTIGFGADIPTPGLTETAFKSTGESLANLPKGMYEATGLRDLLHSRGEILSANLQEEFDKTPEPHYKGLLKNISHATGNLLGIVTPIGIESRILTEANILRKASTASELATGLTFYHDIQKAESIRNPDNPTLAHISALIQSALWMKGIKTFGDLSKGILKSSSPEINDILKSLQKGEIANAAAAKGIANVFVDKVVTAAGKSVTESAKIAGITMANIAVSDILNGKFDLDANINAGVQTLGHMMLSLPLLEIAKVVGSKNMTADYLDAIAKNPEQYRGSITDPAQKKNFEFLLEVNKELEGREDLKPEQRKKVQLIELQKKVLEDKIKDSPSKSLTTKEQKEVAALDIEGRKELGEIGNKEFVEEMYDEELIPKSDRVLVENNETGKFEPNKAGAYLKFIAQQANNLGENWELHEGKAPNMEHYPSQLIEAANKQWAKEIEAARPKDEISQPIELSTELPADYKLPEQAEQPTEVNIPKLPTNEPIKEANPKVKELESQREKEIVENGKPEVKMEFVTADDLVKSSDPVKNKQLHNDIKDRYKELRNLIDCLWKLKA